MKMDQRMKTEKMKLQFAILMLAVASMAAFSGCTIATHYVQEGAKLYPPTSPDSVEIYVADTLGVKYEVIGTVLADTDGNGDDAAKELREEAAKMGANAVIKARLVKFTSMGQRAGLTGIAVRTAL
jgi:hypothetical protein